MVNMKVEVKVFNGSNNPLPRYATKDSSGLDLRANIDGTIVIEPGERALIPTGLKVAIPIGYELQIRPRSGLALKSGISLVNSPGTIDSDYRGDVGIIIINHGHIPFTIVNGDRIAQAVLAPSIQLDWCEVNHESLLSETERGEGGFNSTGVI